MAKNKNEEKLKFHDMLEKKEKMSILKEADYFALTNVLEKISKGKKSYLVLGDFNSINLLDMSREMLKSIKKVDTNLSNINPKNLQDIIEYLDSIKLTLSAINDIAKPESSEEQ